MRCRVTKGTLRQDGDKAELPAVGSWQQAANGEAKEHLAAGSGQMAANQGSGERLAAAWKAKA